ncbi:unnamed protein product [Arabis nemorensis]|uniref:HTH three-helical bundle domain-containing protein n=1 Tax=Arabis nemorensis TaxID=586526 RepID=A0A565BXH3_9BRAS|nr:unnamed protein product [Arabis nemorensis]
MVEFPSTIERTVASSLLLLSYGPVFFSPTRSESVEESSYVSKWCDEGSSNLSLRLGSNGSGSRSCGSDLSSDGSFGKSNDHGFKINYTGDPFHLVNFKRVISPHAPLIPKMSPHACQLVQARSSSIRRRAKAILEFLSSVSSSEVRIRQILGDSPDTSKALRMLLKMEEVKRFGTGGRLDPYIYKIA